MGGIAAMNRFFSSNKEKLFSGGDETQIEI